MDKTTDINALPMADNNQTESNDLVNNILNEIKSNEEENVQMNVQEQQPNQEMPPMYNPNVPQPQYAQEPPQQIYQEMPDFKNENDLMTKLVNNLRNPLIVFVILVVLLLPILDKYISKVVPKLYVGNSSLSYLGVIVKSIIGSLIFYLTTLF